MLQPTSHHESLLLHGLCWTVRPMHITSAHLCSTVSNQGLASHASHRHSSSLLRSVDNCFQVVAVRLIGVLVQLQQAHLGTGPSLNERSDGEAAEAGGSEEGDGVSVSSADDLEDQVSLPTSFMLNLLQVM